MSITITNKNGIETTYNTGLKSTGHTEVKPYIEPKAKTKRYGYRPKFKLGANNIIMSILTGASVTAYQLAFGDTPESVDAIFDAARTANGTFADMSNDQIIDYCSDLSNEQIQGMVSLVHGRYFEDIVAAETGGTLFEAKNHADTDMTLDGEEISIKSNDATADSIEDVETISPQDLDMDDQELYDATAAALDGSDFMVDALFDGFVTMGATMVVRAMLHESMSEKFIKKTKRNSISDAIFMTREDIEAEVLPPLSNAEFMEKVKTTAQELFESQIKRKQKKLNKKNKKTSEQITAGSIIVGLACLPFAIFG